MGYSFDVVKIVFFNNISKNVGFFWTKPVNPALFYEYLLYLYKLPHN